MKRARLTAACLFVLSLLHGNIAASQSGTTHEMAQGDMKPGGMADAAAEKSDCRGFVILANGYAVLSGMSEVGEHGHHATGMNHGDMAVTHGDAQAPPMKHGGGQMRSMEHEAGMKDPFMGLKPGKDIEVTAGTLCVPVDQSTDSWTAVGADKTLHVMVQSVRGSLTHNSRENEALALMVMDEKTPVEDAEVVVIARMPQHDRSMAGGHGLANDPDVKGIRANRSGKGRYIVDPADFSMAGPWLFEIDVKRGARVSKAYFATLVGED